jgi:hypothetical protein
MKALTISLVSIFLSSLAPSLAQDGEDDNIFYSNRYDSLDINLLFSSSQLVNSYVDCLLDKKPCPTGGKNLKRKK